MASVGVGFKIKYRQGRGKWGGKGKETFVEGG